MAKCYFAHGGNELVIGGKVTVLPGAVIEGIENSMSSVEGISQAEGMLNSTATTVSGLREDFNKLLDALREAGLMERESATADEG